jgi:RHS repeat-associated protein
MFLKYTCITSSGGMTRMKAWRGLLGVSVFAMGVGAACAQTPAPVLGNIEAPYAALQATVKIAGGTYGPGTVAYGSAGTPLVLTGSNLGGSGTVQFVSYYNTGTVTSPVETTAGSVQANVTMWSSNMIILTVPSGALSGLVTVKTDEAQTSNGLPFVVMPGTYAGTCPAGPTGTQLQITTASLHDGTATQAYSATLGATGGTAPFTWSVTSGTLPGGLSLHSSTGAISGTPAAASSPTDITFQVTDSSSPPQTNDAVLSLQVEGATLSPATIYSYSSSYDGVGNVTGYTDDPAGVPGVMGTWGFTYDSLNRLATASATWPDTTQQYSCWNYDSFGNRQQQEQSSAAFVSGSGGATACTAQSDATLATDLASYNDKNQITSTNARGVTVSPTYDPSGVGNMTYDGANSYLYDADGRICAVSATPIPGNTVMTGYLYDGDGNRVAKGTITTMSCDPATSGFQMSESYVLGPSGEELTTFSPPASQATWQRTNVYAAGKLLATYDSNGPSLHFHVTDPLGTRRMQLSGTLASIGQPETAIQSLPYGDQLATFVPGLYSPASADDSTPLHFTGKERDSESGNDYFGARYYASSMGRFMTPDPSGLDYADQTNPQSFNLYGYVQNNPLVNIDPDGLDCIYAQDSGSARIQTGDCTNAGGKDDDGVYVNGTVNSATQDNNGNVTSYSTDSGSFLADGTPNNSSVQVTAQDPGVVGALPLETPQVPQQIDPIKLLAIGITVDSQHSFGCIAQAYGFGVPGTAAYQLGQPVAGTKRFISPGSSIGTSPISDALSKAIPVKGSFRAPVGGPGTGVPFRMTQTGNLGRAIGRWAPFVGFAADAYAAAQLGKCL